MSDYAINLLKAIETGDQEHMNAAFGDAMQAKIEDALDARKIEIAQSIYGGGVEQESSDEEQASDDEQDNTVSASEDGTEEV